MSNFKTEKSLNKAMEIKWNALRVSCSQYNMKWLNGMHNLLDWYEKQRKNINL